MPSRTKEEQGLHTLYTPADGNPSLDIVAVHGLNGGCTSTWTSNTQGSGKPTIWLKDLLPEKLPRARVMTFAYQSSVWGNKSVGGVRERAEQLLVALRDERDDNEDVNRAIVFVGHSLGGIIIKQALNKANTAGSRFLDIARCTKGVVFFGTPHRGADPATWAMMTANIISVATGRPPQALLKTLQTNSEDLMKIAEDFRPLARNYAIASFYEEYAHSLIGDVIVQKWSAVMGLPHEESMMLGGDHSSMCKFGRNDRQFNTVWRRIRQAAKGPVLA